MTCAHVRLLGPCFKTGRVDYRPLATDPERRIAAPAVDRNARLPSTARRYTALRTLRLDRPRAHGGLTLPTTLLGRPTGDTSKGYNSPKAPESNTEGKPSRRLSHRRPAGRGAPRQKGRTLQPTSDLRVHETAGLRGPGQPVGTESCRGLCDSTRLPVNGFTYY